MPSGIYIRTEEIRRKNGWSKGLTKETDKRVRKNSEAQLGKHLSEKHRKKISETLKEQDVSTRFKKGKHNSLATEFKKGRISWWEGKELLEGHRRKISKALRGKNNPNWKGGIKLLKERIRGSFKYRQWRSDVFTRDDFTCQKCGDDIGENLNAHHMKMLSSILIFYEITTYEQALKCEELWNINNGLTLCEKCHKENKSND